MVPPSEAPPLPKRVPNPPPSEMLSRLHEESLTEAVTGSEPNNDETEKIARSGGGDEEPTNRLS
jgi:hypothetical protein